MDTPFTGTAWGHGLLTDLPAVRALNADSLRHWLGDAGAVLPLVAVLAIVAGLVFLSILIHVAVCWFLWSCFVRIPVPYRRQEPALVWLLLVPCLNLVWSFLVLPRLAESFQAYFVAQGRTDVGDCGHSQAMLYCVGAVVATVLGWVPVVSLANCVIGPLLLLVLILFLIRVAALKAQIPAVP